METQNLNLITVIKYLQEQYTFNERNRINYELLLKNKDLQKNKNDASNTLKHSLANLNLSNELANTDQVHQVISDSKLKLSSVLKDINILLEDHKSINNLAYNILDGKNEAASHSYAESSKLIVKRTHVSNIPTVSKIIHSNDSIILVSYENGMTEARTLLNNKFTIKSQGVMNFVKNANQCWYSSSKDTLFVNPEQGISIINCNDGKALDLNKKDLFYNFDSCYDFKYNKLAFLDGLDGELIKFVDVVKKKETEIDLSEFDFYSSENRVLDIKFGITETSVLVMTQKSMFIIDYQSKNLLTELKIDIRDEDIIEGVLTVNSNFNSLVLTFVKSNNSVISYVYSLEAFQIANELTHTFTFFEGFLKKVLAVNNLVYYLFDQQIQIRTRDGVLKSRYLVDKSMLFSDIVVNDDKLYHVSQKTRQQKVIMQELST
ncbi:hypothetical protein QEN19_002769 [Hanseniaspora menglaensis]